MELINGRKALRMGREGEEPFEYPHLVFTIPQRLWRLELMPPEGVHRMILRRFSNARTCYTTQPQGSPTGLSTLLVLLLMIA